jgi:hypothetical protein
MLRMVEVTIEITQYCPFECPECSSNASSEGKHLPYDAITDFLGKQKDITRINISGGEPLAHPQFFDILKLCYSMCADVRVYTNALKHIMFNSRVIHGVKVEANVDIVPGLNAYIPTREEASTVHLLKFIPQGRGRNIPNQDVVVSRNFYDPSHCEECSHILLQADGKVVRAPCRKDYQ